MLTTNDRILNLVCGIIGIKQFGPSVLENIGIKQFGPSVLEINKFQK